MQIHEPMREKTVEIISLRVPSECVRSHELFVAHSDLTLGRGRDRGERLVIRDARAGGSYAATVAEVEFLMDDTVYRLDLRGRLPHGVAAQVPAPRKPQRFEVVDVLDLLVGLREPQATAPSDELVEAAVAPAAARV